MNARYNRLQIVGCALLLIALLVVVLSRSGEEDSFRGEKDPQQLTHKGADLSSKVKSESNPSLNRSEGSIKRKPRLSKREQTDSPDSFPEIERLLSSENISIEQAARQLAEIALNAKAPEAERLEAMEHGANLGFSHLVPLSLDPNLPLPIAESYLHGLHGHDQVKEQVSGALGLLNHVDQEIREQAQILLGFLLQAEEDNESPDKLRAAADAFLKQPDEGDGNEH
jgi:hypothetical protein